MTDYTHRFKKFDTNLIHSGSPRPRIEGAVVAPVFQSANFLMADETEYGAVRYLRLSNSPSHLSLQARLAVIESGEVALLASSGMAAISTALLALLRGGGHVLAQRTLYGGTQSFLDEDAKEFGISYSSIDTSDPAGADAWELALQPETRLIYLESISNPLMEVGDLRGIVAFAKQHRLITVIDNTFASPVIFRPLEIGVDLVVHSATKYLNGHSDLVAGVVIGSEENIERIKQLQHHLGGVLDPHACFLLERGLKTLSLRMERQSSSALKLARYLARAPGVRRVNYPGLATDPGHQYASSLFRGYGGMLSFYCDDAVRATRFLERVRIPLHAASLGGTESLVVRPARSSHLGLSEADRQSLGVTDDLIRVSVGLEDIEELIEDFSLALEG
jgi:cystathionine beta-lyase/cystathionine gamma-synthase